MLKTRDPDLLATPQAQLAIAREVLMVEAAALNAVKDRLNESFLQAVQRIIECEGSVIVTGMGKAGIVGQKVTATLASTGTRAHFLHPAEAVHGDLGRVCVDDVLLAFSHSGETAEVTQILGPVRDIGAPIIAVTSRSQSTLARMAQTTIAYGAVSEACPNGLAPSTSCTVMMAIGDAIAFVLMRLRAFTDDDFGRFHPAGSLGRKLQRVEEVMRVGAQLRVAHCQLSVSEVFIQGQRPGRRTGALVLVDDEGKLCGIFTDSDLARLFERRDPSLFDRPIREFMTQRPVTLRVGQRVRDALQLLKSHHLSEIPVLDDEERPQGIIDITDLVDLLPQAA